MTSASIELLELRQHPRLAEHTSFFESSRSVPDVPGSGCRHHRTLDLNNFLRADLESARVAFLGSGKTVDGDSGRARRRELVRPLPDTWPSRWTTRSCHLA